jgi:hypothetical protein
MDECHFTLSDQHGPIEASRIRIPRNADDLSDHCVINFIYTI